MSVALPTSQSGAIAVATACKLLAPGECESKESGMSLLARAYWLLLNAAQLVITLLWTVCWIPVALLVRLLTGSTRVPLRMASWIWAPLLVRGAPARLQLVGNDAIDWDRPCVLVANHQSMMDIPVLFMAVPTGLRFMLKSELAKVPFLGWYTRAMGMVFVDRDRPGSAHGQLAHAAQLVGQGACLVAFPEGTRSRDARVGQFKTGAFRVAIGAGVDVVPVAIRGSGRVMPPGGFNIRPGQIRVSFGQPISCAGMRTRDARELARRARQAIIDMLEAE